VEVIISHKLKNTVIVCSRQCWYGGDNFFAKKMVNPDINTDKINANQVIDLARILFEHIEGQIKASDSKAWLSISANGILLTLLNLSIENLLKSLYGGAAKSSLLVLGKLGQQATWYQNLAAVFCLLMFLSILISLGFAFWSVKPVLGGRKSTKNKSGKNKNLFYFGDIQDHKQDEFIQAFQNQSLEMIGKALLTQVHIKASIADRKFTLLSKSMIAMMVSLVCWALALLVLSFQ
jgi:hypothetical protein